MTGIIDFHTHILPGIDDGSRSSEDTLELLRQEKEQGITHVIATPHFYPQHDKPERFLSRRAAAVERLEEVLAENPGFPKVTVGAEVYYFRGISGTDVLREFTLGSGKYILIEMPSSVWTDAMYRELEGIYSKRNLIPVIAHINRYISPFRSKDVLNRLSELPVLIQANSEFFLRPSTARMAMKLLQHEQIHLLGSDCHNLTSRKPDLGKAVELIERKLGSEALAPVLECQECVLAENRKAF